MGCVGLVFYFLAHQFGCDAVVEEVRLEILAPPGQHGPPRLDDLLERHHTERPVGIGSLLQHAAEALPRAHVDPHRDSGAQQSQQVLVHG